MITKNIAKLAILSELLQFPTINNKDWISTTCNDITQKGDLVAPNCILYPHKWYISWVVDITVENGIKKYLLESIEDGSLCWFSNVGISIYNRDKIDESWRWSDKQFKFYYKWLKVCKKNDAYIIRPRKPVFDGKNVTLDVRVMFSEKEFSNPETFQNWEKVTMRMLDKYYKESVAKYELKYYKTGVKHDN